MYIKFEREREICMYVSFIHNYLFEKIRDGLLVNERERERCLCMSHLYINYLFEKNRRWFKEFDYGRFCRRVKILVNFINESQGIYIQDKA